ncbi:glycosyltransferase family 2 protein [Porphyromonas cangingivalis]|uniref:glycosyltransferase family 2 protein n=1 Tax=Porphyromonas cangingivalis TaxID=36874 RepID=UPI000B2EEA95
MKESLTIIIPCYNEEDVLETTFQRLLGILPMIPELEVSFLFVNDGSKDGTAMILNRFAREQERVQVIHFSRNFGHQSAVTAGINHAVSDYVVVIDADLQDPPEAIPEMWHYLKDQNANVVYGVRQERRDETWFKKCTAKIFYRLLNYLSETPFPVDTGDFRIMDRKVIEEFNALPEHNKYIRGSSVGWDTIRSHTTITGMREPQGRPSTACARCSSSPSMPSFTFHTGLSRSPADSVLLRSSSGFCWACGSCLGSFWALHIPRPVGHR